jgi:hypothetical protein
LPDLAFASGEGDDSGKQHSEVRDRRIIFIYEGVFLGRKGRIAKIDSVKLFIYFNMLKSRTGLSGHGDEKGNIIEKANAID